jgi:hypothetical protein
MMEYRRRSFAAAATQRQMPPAGKDHGHAMLQLWWFRIAQAGVREGTAAAELAAHVLLCPAPRQQGAAD